MLFCFLNFSRDRKAPAYRFKRRLVAASDDFIAFIPVGSVAPDKVGVHIKKKIPRRLAGDRDWS